MKKNLIVILLFFALLLNSKAVKFWAIGESVQINPENNKAWEENEKLGKISATINGSGGDTESKFWGKYLKTGYRDSNWVWNGTSISLSGSKNEVIACQLIIEKESTNLTGINVNVSNLQKINSNEIINNSNIKLYREWYIYINTIAPPDSYPYFSLGIGWYPDALIPLNTSPYGNSFDIPSSVFYMTNGPSLNTTQKNQAIWIDVYIPKNQIPGDYQGTITITGTENSIPFTKEIPIKIIVLNFTLSDEKNTTCELMSYGFLHWLSKDLRTKYYQLGQEHRLSFSDNKIQIDWNQQRNGNAKFNDSSWQDFVNDYKEVLDGTAFTWGPGAGKPIDFMMLPFNVEAIRPDVEKNSTGRNWPVAPTNGGSDIRYIQLDDAYKECIKSLLKDWVIRFNTVGWNKTKLVVWIDGFDEPGFHHSKAFDPDKYPEMDEVNGPIIARALCNLIKDYSIGIVKSAGEEVKNKVLYRIDIGGGFRQCLYDLNGDNIIETAPKEVIKTLKDAIDIWNICGSSMHKPKYLFDEGENYQFYQGPEGKMGNTVVSGESLGFRTWSIISWMKQAQKSCVWKFYEQDEQNPFREIIGYFGPSSDEYIYKGTKLHSDLNMPIATLRLKAMRRGIQDYEYLQVLTNSNGGNKTQSDTLVSEIMEPYVLNDGLVGYQGYWNHNPSDWFLFQQKVAAEILKKSDNANIAISKNKTINNSYPNPFNPECYIDISNQLSSVSKIKIYNILGQVVRELNVNNGSSSVYWDGRDNFGKELSSGMYFYEILANNKVQNCRKMLMLK